MTQQPNDYIKAPPYSEDAELAVLGAVMLDNNAMLDVRDKLDPSHFYRESHRHIARAMWALYDDDHPIDTVTVLEWLDQRDRIDKAGQSKVVRLSEYAPFGDQAAHYAKMVREHYHRRELIKSCENVTHRLYGKTDYDSEQASDDIVRTAQAVRGQATADVDYSVRRHLQDEFKRIERLVSGSEAAHYKTGISVIDDNEDFVDNFSDQKLIGIAAKPKQGKSKLANRIASHFVEHHGFACDQWYTDGPGGHWGTDVISHRAKVCSRKMRRRPHTMTESEWARVTKWFATVKDWPVRNFDIGKPHIRDIMVTTKKRLADLDGERPLLLVVDYIQNVTADGDTQLERLNAAIDGLRELRTNNRNLIIIALMQFNRSAGGGMGRSSDAGEPMPRPDQLKGTSDLEQALDSLFIWHRPKLYSEQASPDEKAKGLLWLALTKYTSPGVEKVYADMSTSKFEKFSERGGYPY